jgi:hypothetical protein
VPLFISRKTPITPSFLKGAPYYTPDLLELFLREPCPKKAYPYSKSLKEVFMLKLDFEVTPIFIGISVL